MLRRPCHAMLSRHAMLWYMLYVQAMLYMLWYMPRYMLWYMLWYMRRRTHASQGFSRSSVYSPSIRDGSNSGVPPAPG